MQGGLQVRRMNPDAILVFIEPPSLEVLETRLRGRGTEDEKTIQTRLANAKREMEFADTYDVRIVNDSLDDALCELEAVFDTYESDEGSQKNVRN